MKQSRAFAAIMVFLAMPALAIVPDQDDWTVVTMAPDGSWGSATELSVGRAPARAIDNCKVMSGTKIGCGAQSRAIQGRWIQRADYERWGPIIKASGFKVNQ
jgi:hypothetical protein